MAPGPPKQFDPSQALLRARDVFWRRGYDGASLSELEDALGIGRKSLYDTFGSKRELYLRALDCYVDTVIGRICAGLEDPRGTPLANLERVLGKLQRHHASTDSLGCLLGVAMGQAERADEDVAARVRGGLERLERGFERALRRARDAGELRPGVSTRDAARNLVALTQGLALMGRVGQSPASSRSIVRAALQALRP